jgi:hypothetical protein
MILLLKLWLRPKPGHDLELEMALALACVFQSQSHSKLGQSYGFQAKLGWHITSSKLRFKLEPFRTGLKFSSKFKGLT